MTTTALLSSVDRTSVRLAALSYRLQHARIEWGRLVARLQAISRRCDRPLLEYKAPPIPLWRFARQLGKVRMVPLATIRGAEASRCQLFHCTPQQLDGSGVACLVLSGELDLASAPTFRAHLAAAYGADGLLLDLRDLRYLDSSGINALLDAHRALASSGRRIALIGTSAQVRRILSVLHLEDLMPVFPNLDEALQYLRLDGKRSPEP